MPVLRRGLQGGVPGEHPVDVALVPGEELLHLLGVAVGGGLDELLGDVAGDVGLEQLLEQGGQALWKRME